MKESDMHLMIDSKLNSLVNPQKIHDFLMRCPSEIGMTRITEPYIQAAGDWCMGIVILAESHISVHVEHGIKCFCDMFSCKPFDITHGVKFAAESLDMIRSTIATKVIEWRGEFTGLAGLESFESDDCEVE